ncbi:hypothetical protein LshimejAT787_1900760 [Lyophyllum shimeji]|uniref:Uncharacterized protein n=1 Tax=Lyophyllum shimeji TaxID=47721 RepID=A0A9P3PZS8_LYOSH|nr:hypothetical protein LshimejAT787_1900760 [Lyophyllum shimeji]
MTVETAYNAFTPWAAESLSVAHLWISSGDFHLVRFSIQWSSIALLYYDYTLTLGMEMQSGYIVSSAISVVGRAAVIIVWAARTFAVCDKNRWIRVYLGTIGLMIFILDVIGADRTVISLMHFSSPHSVGRLLTIMMCVFEISTVGLTTTRSIQSLNVDRPWWKQERSYTYIIFEQGVLYFCVVTGLTVTSLALNIAIPGGFFQRLLDAYTFPLSGLMTARFFLHLRRWQAKRTAFRSSCVCLQDESDIGEWRHATPPQEFIADQPEGSSSQCAACSQSQGASEYRLVSTSVSLLDEFSDDPVRNAQAPGSVGPAHPRSDMESRFYTVYHTGLLQACGKSGKCRHGHDLGRTEHQSLPTYAWRDRFFRLGKDKRVLNVAPTGLRGVPQTMPTYSTTERFGPSAPAWPLSLLFIDLVTIDCKFLRNTIRIQWTSVFCNRLGTDNYCGIYIAIITMNALVICRRSPGVTPQPTF